MTIKEQSLMHSNTIIFLSEELFRAEEIENRVKRFFAVQRFKGLIQLEKTRLAAINPNYILPKAK